MRRNWKRAALLAALVVVCGAVAVAMATRPRASEQGPAGPIGAGSASASGSAVAADAAPSAWSPKWDTEEIPTYKLGVPLRPMDRDIIAALRSGHVERTAMTDLFPDRPYQVRLAGSAELNQFRYVLVDLNRDGKWDERWDLGKPGQIWRQVEHDPDAMGQEVMYTLSHGRWQIH